MCEILWLDALKRKEEINANNFSNKRIEKEIQTQLCTNRPSNNSAKALAVLNCLRELNKGWPITCLPPHGEKYISQRKYMNYSLYILVFVHLLLSEKGKFIIFSITKNVLSFFFVCLDKVR